MMPLTDTGLWTEDCGGSQKLQGSGRPATGTSSNSVKVSPSLLRDLPLGDDATDDAVD